MAIFPKSAKNAGMSPRSLAFGLAVAGLAIPAAAQSPIRAVKTAEPVVALSFDDGPQEPNTRRLIELFAREGVRATFFEVGDNVRRHPELARALVAAGHEIGNHSKTHPKLGEIAEIELVRAEVVETQAAVVEITGKAPTVFRAPYISHGPALWAVLAELKLPSVSSRLHVADWEGTVTAEAILERASQAEPGDVILLHTWQDKTLQALPEIIRRLRAKGLRFVTVSELLALGEPAS